MSAFLFFFCFFCVAVSFSSLHIGPGLSIRVICAEEPYICKDFAETNNILKIVTDFSASVKKVSVLVQSIFFTITEQQ